MPFCLLYATFKLLLDMGHLLIVPANWRLDRRIYPNSVTEMMILSQTLTLNVMLLCRLLWLFHLVSFLLSFLPETLSSSSLLSDEGRVFSSVPVIQVVVLI